MDLDKEIVDSFQEESSELIGQLRTIIENLEDHQGDFPKKLLEEFANLTDRIMGTAKTFAGMYPEHKTFDQIGKFAELCKATGYKASTLNHPGLIPIFAAFWADTIDIVDELCQNIGDEKKLQSVTKNYIPILQKRLVWLAQQIVTLTKGSGNEATINVDGILKKMGIDV